MIESSMAAVMIITLRVGISIFRERVVRSYLTGVVIVHDYLLMDLRYSHDF